ncbi:MAG: subfamily B ATP-binding cassette protein MsbA [Myxococcota bacterium]|jgi:subfamily B ATP-binding cassette protein MsbA
MNPNVRRLLGYFAPYRLQLAAAIGMIVLHSAIPGVMVLLIRDVLDEVLIARDQTRLALVPGVLIVLFALNGALTFGRGMLTRYIAWKVVTTLREELFACYLSQDIAWHQSQPVGELLARLSNDVTNVHYGVSGIVTAVQKPLTLLVLIAVAFHLNPRLALIGMIALPLVAVPIDRFGKRLRRTSRGALDNMAALTGSAVETLSGVRVVQSHNGEEQRQQAFAEENERYRKQKMDTFAALLLPGPVVEMIAVVGVAAALWYGGQQVIAGEVAPGELIAFLFAMSQLNAPLKGLAEIQSLTQRALAGSEAVFAALDRAPAVSDDGTQTLQTDRIQLTFEGVSFDYGDGPVLTDLKLDIPPGKTVALVGASGSGKSTAANLIPRFYDPAAGRILVNGQDIRTFSLHSLRRHIALVSQEGFLFNDTVRDNIGFGQDADEAEIIEAAKMAHAHDFITALPQGYDTRLDELGMRLSGGQRQRICIARAFLRDAPLLVLDEATSALDTASERLVQEALDRLSQHRTVLAIAHRLSTIRHADEIIVLHEGVVVERGRHDELVKLGGPYAGLVSGQG